MTDAQQGASTATIEALQAYLDIARLAGRLERACIKRAVELGGELARDLHGGAAGTDAACCPDTAAEEKDRGPGNLASRVVSDCA